MHDQPSLFDLPAKDRTPPKEDVTIIRRHLRWVGRVMSNAVVLPWPESEMQRWERDFPAAAQHLPQEEAEPLVARFQENIARLRATDKPSA